MLITSGVEPKALPGRLISLETDGGEFEFGGQVRRFKSDKTFGVIMAKGLRESETPPIAFTLNDGSKICGRIQSATADKCQVTTLWGGVTELSTSRFLRLDVRSERLQYLSALDPVSIESKGIVHDPWAVRKDKSVTGRPITLDGAVYDRGFGVHSFTAMDFAIGGAYETLSGTIGIDDAVRPRGSVVFRVIGDDEILFDSGDVSGAARSRSIKIDVRGVDMLRLVVDYGEGLDLSDHADWADVRLIRPKKEDGQT